MSDNNTKTVELTDIELEAVSGGAQNILTPAQRTAAAVHDLNRQQDANCPGCYTKRD